MNWAVSGFSRVAGTIVVGVAMLLNACSLPPREAWNKVRQEGLVPVLLAHRNKNKGSDGTSGRIEKAVDSEVIVTDALEDSVPDGETTQETEFQIADSQDETADEDRGNRQPFGGLRGLFRRGAPTAKPVPGSDHHVYSPFTGEDKGIDVKGLAGGSRARCPYTGRIFIVPKSEQWEKAEEGDDGPMIAESSESDSDGAGERKLVAQGSQRESDDADGDGSPTRSSEGPELLVDSGEKPEAKPKPTQTHRESMPPAKPGLSRGEIPVATRVPARPGFVRSPFAKQNQLVEVTGLAPGQEVRCPYSGKLFKVPPLGDDGRRDQTASVSDSNLPSSATELGPEGSPSLLEPVENTPEVASGAEGIEPIDDSKTPKTPVLPTDATGLARPEPEKANADPNALKTSKPGQSEKIEKTKPTPSAPKPSAGGANPSLPVAKRVAGRKGLVHSPYGASGQLVDVSGKKPGSKVRCPFTGKAFLVPE